MKKKNNMQKSPLKDGIMHPFRVPGDYFENLPLRIQDRVHEDLPDTGRISRIRPRLAYAAMIAVLIVAGYLGIHYFSDGINVNGLTRQEIDNVIEYYAFEMNEEILVSALMESDPDIFKQETDTETDQIIEYLAQEYIDFSQFLNGN